MFPYKIDDDTTLRLLEDRDAEVMFALIQSNRATLDHWMRWTGRIQSIDDVQQLIERYQQTYADNNGFNAGIWYQEQFAGGLVCHSVNYESRKTEIGYWLGADFRKKGLVTRASRAVSSATVCQMFVRAAFCIRAWPIRPYAPLFRVA